MLWLWLSDVFLMPIFYACSEAQCIFLLKCQKVSFEACCGYSRLYTMPESDKLYLIVPSACMLTLEFNIRVFKKEVI